jgi:hypothetical protein
MQQPEKKTSSLAVFVVILFFIAPPLGILAAIALAVYSQRKKNAASAAGTTKPTAPRPTPVKREPVQEKGRPNVSHVHTPQTYSYDACAKEKRLEQLETLKKAGLLEKDEYAKRRQEILRGK